MKEDSSKFQINRQKELLATHVDSEFIPIADAPEEMVESLLHQKLEYLTTRINYMEEEVNKIKAMLLGDESSSGVIITYSQSLEKLQNTILQLLKSTEQLDEMLVHALRMGKDNCNSEMDYIKQKLNSHEERLSSLEKKKRMRRLK